MRELKDYFCTFAQREALIELGLSEDSHELSCEHYNILRTPFAGFLRSQALDFFRELGYHLTIHQNEKGHWYETQIHNITRIQPGWHKINECESMLIDRLIELEKEARNGD